MHQSTNMTHFASEYGPPAEDGDKAEVAPVSRDAVGCQCDRRGYLWVNSTAWSERTKCRLDSLVSGDLYVCIAEPKRTDY